MTAAAVTSGNLSTFPSFSNLAPELRDQIWHDALPDTFGPALYFYKKGCWSCRESSEADENYYENYDEDYYVHDTLDPELNPNLRFDWRHDLLNNAQSEVPLLFVNREARRIALIWRREQGTRPFDPMSDAYYVAPDKWDDFVNEPDNIVGVPERLYGALTCSDLRKVAISEAHLRSNDFLGIFHNSPNIRVLYIVVGAQPDLQCVDDSKKVQQRWEFERIPGRSLFWNHQPDLNFVFRGSQDSIGDEALYTPMKDMNAVLTKFEMVTSEVNRLEIRPVLAVRK